MCTQDLNKWNVLYQCFLLYFFTAESLFHLPPNTISGREDGQNQTVGGSVDKQIVSIYLLAQCFSDLNEATPDLFEVYITLDLHHTADYVRKVKTKHITLIIGILVGVK